MNNVKLTRRGKIVALIAVLLVAFGVGIATSNVCYWGSCSSLRTSVSPAEASAPAPMSSATVPVFDASGAVSRVRAVSRSVQRTKPCSNALAQTLYRAGFRGENLHEAWAIAMRESHGDPTAVSVEDYGLFQFNYPTWGNILDYNRILEGDYNARQAFRISKGGSTWAHWGLTGSGVTDPSLYGMWSSDQVWAWITEPYERYYNRYPEGCQ